MKTPPTLKELSKLPLNQVLPEIYYTEDDWPERLKKSTRNSHIFTRFLLLPLIIGFGVVGLAHLLCVILLTSMIIANVLGYFPHQTISYLHVLGALLSGGLTFCCFKAIKGFIQLAQPEPNPISKN